MKVVTVDLALLLKEYPGTSVAEKNFKKVVDKKQKEIADLEDDLKDMQNELKSSSSVLSAKQKRAKQTEFEAKYEAYMTRKNQVSNELENQRIDTTKVILGQIKAIAAGVAKDKGVDLILDSEKTVYVNGGVDFTDDVLKSKGFKSADAGTTDDSDGLKNKK